MSPVVLDKVHGEMSGLAEEFDAMINLSGVDLEIKCSVSDSNIFEEYEILNPEPLQENYVLEQEANKMTQLLQPVSKVIRNQSSLDHT